MNRSIPIDGILALVFLAIAVLLRLRIPLFTSSAIEVLSLLSAAASLVFAMFGLRSPQRYDKFCAKIALAFLVGLMICSWFFGGIVP